MMDYNLLKKFLFLLDPERAHAVGGFALRALRYSSLLRSQLEKSYFVDDDVLHQNIFDKEFKNPIGLAAGFDKDGRYITSTRALGFGFTEIGTVTPKPQEGNEKPRLFRLVEDEAIQNAMGFNNRGAKMMLQELKKLGTIDYPVGINIGKNKLTLQDDALMDYEKLFKIFDGYGDYVVINISSPNTPGLRDLQNENFIESLFALAKSYCDKPVLLKIAPDMSTNSAVDLAKVAIASGAEGIIATNTTIDYTLVASKNKRSFGGISGKPLKKRSYEILRALGEELYSKTVLISVGGIDSPKEAYRRIRAGASLLQIYSMLIYSGPSLIKQINEQMARMIREDGFESITQAVGADLGNSK